MNPERLAPPTIHRQRPDLWIPSHEKVIAALGKYPAAIEENTFNERGLVETPEGLLVPVYVGSGYGFSPEEREELLEKKLYPDLRAIGVLPLCPFTACGEFLPEGVFDTEQKVVEQLVKWERFNKVVGLVNYGILMPRAYFMYAILNGSPPDEGVVAETAYFASNFGPVVGIRTDFRPAENPAAPINPAITPFMTKRYGGSFYSLPSTYEDALEGVRERVAAIIGHSLQS